MKYNRFLPLIIPLLDLILFETYYFKHNLIYVVAILAVLLLFFAIRQFIIAGNSGDRWYNHFISPTMLILGVIALTTMIANKWLVQILLVGTVILIYLYLRMLYIYLVNFNLKQKEGLENFSAYSNFLAFYFVASSLYGIRAFLNYEVWPLMLLLLVSVALVVYQIFWINSIKLNIGSFYILLIALVVTELAWAATFLTLSYYILGLIVAICYYILSGITRFHLKGILDGKIVKLYLFFGFSSILIVLLSARWFEI